MKRRQIEQKPQTKAGFASVVALFHSSVEWQKSTMNFSPERQRFARSDKATMMMWQCHPRQRRQRTRRAQRWRSWCPQKTNSSTTSLSPKWDEWTSWDFIWIRNEVRQRKLIRHHFPRTGQAMNRPKEHHLLRLILYCIPPVTPKPSIAPLPGMNQDMGSPNTPQGRRLREKNELHHQAPATEQWDHDGPHFLR